MRTVPLALALALAAAPAEAGILVEGTLEGQEVRVELGAIVTDRAVVTVDGDRSVVELSRRSPAMAATKTC